MSNRKQSGEKSFDGKMKDKPFQIIERGQAFSAKVFMASAGAQKEYRFTICKIIQGLSCDLIHNIRIANAFDLESVERMEMHNASLEIMEKINDLLPVLRRCRCITIGQESELAKDLSSLKFGYKKWIESDQKRIAYKNR